MNTNDVNDVVVVGGGAAGLSAALMLTRARRRVVVVDGGQPRNAPAQGVHGLLGLDGINPADLLARGREEVMGYGGRIITGEVVDTAKTADGFAVTLVDGSVLLGRRLLIATGLVDELPALPGVAELWGSDVVHCPYCHGWEVKDRIIGVLATGPMAVHQALLFRQWSPDIRLFSNGQSLTPEDLVKLRARNIEIIDGEVAGLDIASGRLSGVRLAGGPVIEVGAVAVASRMVVRAKAFSRLGVNITEHPMGGYIAADTMGRTEVPGVWVAGNAADLSAQVGAAAADGARVAAQINFDLINAETEEAVAALTDLLPLLL